MTTTAHFAIAHDSPYSDKSTHTHAEFTLNPKEGLCQGRKPDSGWSFHTSHPCENKAKRVIKATFQSGDYTEEIELHVCGVHDLQAKGNRKAAKIRLERQAQARREENYQTVESDAQEFADRVNALVGSTVIKVHAQYHHHDRNGYVTYSIVVVDRPALERALGGTQ